ncbi:MAG: hypothetical protein ABIQ12_07875 [Opitutaceae bacterium]
MKLRLALTPFPLPAIIAALAAIAALPFSLAAAGTLGFTAALGTIIADDYGRRCRRVRLPRRAAAPASVLAPAKPNGKSERHPLAA